MNCVYILVSTYIKNVTKLCACLYHNFSITSEVPLLPMNIYFSTSFLCDVKRYSFL